MVVVTRILLVLCVLVPAVACAEGDGTPAGPDGFGGVGGGVEGGTGGAAGDSGTEDGPPCWPGHKWCGSCADPADPTHGCGEPGCEPCVVPNATAGCDAGKCSVATCQSGYQDCDNDASNGCETNSQASHDHCGGCGKACSPSQLCLQGKCSSTCGALTNCSGSCVDTTSDPQHCGNCTTVCGPGSTCANGACGCTSGLTSCAGACTDTKTSKPHCGGCNKPCVDPKSGVAVCSSGSCVYACNGGFTLCSGQCVNTGSDPIHCGTCNNGCSGGKTCQSGTCACPPGSSWCNGQCSAGSCCGQEGQACCAGNACGANLRCIATFDQSSPLVVDWKPGCVRCGQSGQAACLSGATPSCLAGLTVVYDAYYKIHMCFDSTGTGGPGEKCSVSQPGSCYSSGYACVTLAGNDMCSPCGVFNYVCCPSEPKCQPGLSCQFINNNLCKP